MPVYMLDMFLNLTYKTFAILICRFSKCICTILSSLFIFQYGIYRVFWKLLYQDCTHIPEKQYFTYNQPPAETNSDELHKLFSLCRLTTVLPNVIIKETAKVKVSQWSFVLCHWSNFWDTWCLTASEKFIAALLSVMLLEMIDLYLHVCVCVCVCQVQVLWKVCMLQIWAVHSAFTVFPSGVCIIVFAY